MTARDLAEDIVQELYDTVAEEGIDEVFVVFRVGDEIRCGYSSDDMLSLADEIRHVLAEAEGEREPTRRLH